MTEDLPPAIPPGEPEDTAAAEAAAAAMANAVAAAQAAFGADPLIHASPPGTPGRRERMAGIIREAADRFEVERMELTMALTQASMRPN